METGHVYETLVLSWTVMWLMAKDDSNTFIHYKILKNCGYFPFSTTTTTSVA